MNLKELSALLGLSQTTVSRALNGYPEVKEATRQKVLAAAEAHNYAPNTRAQSLATGHYNAIGHVLPMANQHEIVNPIFGDFIAGAGEIYAQHSYEMVLSIVDDNDEDTIYRAFKSRGSVDGVILHGPKMHDSRIPLLQKIGLPFVVHGRASGIETPYSWLDVNNRSAFRRAANFLLDLGHRRIALVNGLEAMDFAHRRRLGYADALEARDIPLDPDLLHSNEMTEHFGYAATRDTLALPNPPTAFLVSSLISAIGVRRAIEEQGLQMGRDISVITHDDNLSYLGNGGDVPIFTATRSSVRDAGRAVASMLLDQIQNPHAASHQKLLEVELTVGQSTGPAPRVTQHA